MLPFLPMDEIEEMATWQDARINEAKDILAFELTKMVHGEEEAENARKASRALFAGGADAEVPTTEVTDEDFRDGTVDLLTLMVKGGMVPSRSEARRAVEQGGVTVNGEKETDIRRVYSRDELSAGLLVKRGKKTFRKFVLA